MVEGERGQRFRNESCAPASLVLWLETLQPQSGSAERYEAPSGKIVRDARGFESECGQIVSSSFMFYSAA